MWNGVFQHMTDERIEELKVETFLRLSELKKLRDGFQAQFSAWSSQFSKASKQLSVGAPPAAAFDFATLPPPSKVAESWEEYQRSLQEIAEIEYRLEKLGVKL